MVPVLVQEPEKLFVSQETPVWCWAATASALRNYFHPESVVFQSDIALNNPNVKDNNYVVPYFAGSKFLIPSAHDYLIDDVLSSARYQGHFKAFSARKAKELLNDSHPFSLVMNNHIFIVYGYFQSDYIAYFLLFDPNSLNWGNNPFSFISQYHLENYFGETSASMIFMQSKDIQISSRSFLWE